MAEHTPDALVQQVDPHGDSSVHPSAERIRQLALKKRREFLNEQEEKPMKKGTFQVALIAALICLVTASAFALGGGLQYIRHIFGDSAETVENAVATPQIVASGGGRTLELEALLSDGFVTNMVLSLTGEAPRNDTENLFTVTGNGPQFRGIAWSELEAYSNAEKTVYRLELVSDKRLDAATFTLALNPSVAPINMQVDVQSQLSYAVVNFLDGAMCGQTKLVQLQLSALGLLLIGEESNDLEGLPSTDIQLIFKDGNTESVNIEFDPNGKSIDGSGGAVMGEKQPLVASFAGTRNPDGQLVISAEFSRIIQPDNLRSVIVGGAEYPIH